MQRTNSAGCPSSAEFPEVEIHQGTGVRRQEGVVATCLSINLSAKVKTTLEVGAQFCKISFFQAKPGPGG